MSGLTEKQQQALKLGETIRQVVCMDSIAARYLPRHLRDIVRGVCDEKMHLLGYESLTEHSKRISAVWETDLPEKWTNKEWALFYKYRKLGDAS